MAEIKLVSWNVNGLRAVVQKPDWQWFHTANAHVVALQETKAEPSQLTEDVRNPEGWHAYWASSQVKKGYSGVATFCREAPQVVHYELPEAAFQGEGRLIHAEFPAFHFFNVYFPNGGEELAKGVFKRVPYKMGFFRSFLTYAEELRQQKPIVVCGDFNISHKEADLARPRENACNTGFLREERAFLDEFIAAGYVDTFRHIHGETTGDYSWWSYKTRAREKNVGWRLDYFFVSKELAPAIRNAWIENNVFGSDHCPVGLCLDV